MEAHDIIIRPIITEKTMDGNTQKKYTFEVDKAATKIDVKRAVEAAFGVKVSKVNTLHVRGRLRRQGILEMGDNPAGKGGGQHQQQEPGDAAEEQADCWRL